MPLGSADRDPLCAGANRRVASGRSLLLLALLLLQPACAPDPATLVGRSDLASRGRALALCSRDPECLGYLEVLKQRVFNAWHPRRDMPVGKVRVAFTLIGTGEVEDVRVVKSANDLLGESCIEAFRTASPFPPPPDSIAYLFEKELTATFDFAERR